MSRFLMRDEDGNTCPKCGGDGDVSGLVWRRRLGKSYAREGLWHLRVFPYGQGYDGWAKNDWFIPSRISFATEADARAWCEARVKEGREP